MKLPGHIRMDMISSVRHAFERSNHDPPRITRPNRRDMAVVENSGEDEMTIPEAIMEAAKLLSGALGAFAGAYVAIGLARIFFSRGK